MGKSSATIAACPLCRHPLERRRRSLLDRVRTLFTSNVRYRCTARCGWQGLIPRLAHESGRSRYILGPS